jgi:phosphopantothenoylcysteine decarboxylase/phosphopantothenate--cysteine ligase
MRLLVSAGPTREFFDPVRFITNPSSGRMGYAIAKAAAARGHEVTLVSGPVGIDPPKGVRLVVVVTAAQMAAACKRAFRRADAAVMAAAVCDYRPARRAGRKVPKTNRPIRVVLEPTEDIAASLGRRKGRRVLVGFALEDRAGRLHAERKLRAKHFDLIVLNGPANIGSRNAKVEFYCPAQDWSGPISGTKDAVARRIVRAVEQMVESPR